MTRDLRTLIYLLNLELREECSRTMGWGMGWNPVCNRGAAVEADAIGRAAVEVDAIGEQQLKRTQSGSSSRSGRDPTGAAAGGGGKRGAAVEADAAIGPGSSS